MAISLKNVLYVNIGVIDIKALNKTPNSWRPARQPQDPQAWRQETSLFKKEAGFFLQIMIEYG